MVSLMTFLTYVPGAATLAIFFIVLLGLFVYYHSSSWAMLAQAVFICFVLSFGLEIIQAVNGHARPFSILTNLLISGVVYLLWHAEAKWKQICALPAAAALLALATWQFTMVPREVVMRATWVLEQPDPGAKIKGALTTFELGPKESDSVYSNEIAAYLAEKKSSTVDVTLDLIYHWGAFEGYSLKLVDGKSFPTSEAGYGSVGCYKICNPYYFGTRSFHGSSQNPPQSPPQNPPHGAEE